MFMLCSKMISVILYVLVLFVVNDVQSHYVRHPEISRTVFHKKVIATWDEAKQECEAEGAVMASPLDERMLQYMRSSIGINDHNTPYFIGFRAVAYPEFAFTSVEGVPLEDLPEAVLNMIETLNPEHGDCLSMDRHNIRVVSCKAQLPYLCYKNDTSISETTVPGNVMTNCSLGYTQVSGSYYKIEIKSETWDDAQQICLAEGGYLAVLNDAQEAQAVIKLVFDTYGQGWIWLFIGVRDREKNGNWQSVLGNPLEQIYHTWSTQRSNYHCGTIDYEANIDDIDCAWKLPYVCEKQC